METIIDRRGGGDMSLADFAEKHSLTLVVRERSRAHAYHWPRSRYYAKFDGVEVMENGMLASVYGDGETIEAATAEYAKKLEGQRIAVGAYTDVRREIDVPNVLTVGGAS